MQVECKIDTYSNHGYYRIVATGVQLTMRQWGDEDEYVEIILPNGASFAVKRTDLEAAARKIQRDMGNGDGKEQRYVGGERYGFPVAGDLLS